MDLAVADTEVSPVFQRDFYPPPQPNQVTVNFPAVGEQASDKAQPNRTDGWALFAFCCYLFMCLFFLSLPSDPPFAAHPPDAHKEMSFYIRYDMNLNMLCVADKEEISN